MNTNSLYLPNLPCNGGMMAPPNIIIIKKAEPWMYIFLRPAIASAKNTWPHNGTEKTAAYKSKTEIIPVVKKPMIMATDAK